MNNEIKLIELNGVVELIKNKIKAIDQLADSLPISEPKEVTAYKVALETLLKDIEQMAVTNNRPFHVGRNVKEIRKQKNMTQAEVAEKMGLTSNSAIAQMENNVWLREATLKKFANVFDCSPEYIINYGFVKQEYME